MELDKRIKTITDIQSVTFGCNDWESHKKGYFANRIADFKDLSKCMYGKYVEYRYHDKCFLCEVDLSDGTSDRDWYAYFIPEDVLKPEEPEKKYRAFTLAEWIDRHKIGDIIRYRCKSQKIELRQMYVGTQHSQGIKNIIVKITLGNESHTLDYLFENYEIEVDGKWHPFGVEEQIVKCQMKNSKNS